MNRFVCQVGTMKHLFGIVTVILAITACGGSGKSEFDIHGVWTLECIHLPEGNDYAYPEHHLAVPVKVFADSSYYVGLKASGLGRFVLAPSYSGRYKLIDKGGGERLYIEDGNLHKFTIVNDSTIHIGDVGRIYEWRKMDGRKSVHVADIMSVIEHNQKRWDEDKNSYVFTEREHALETDRQNLALAILCIALVLILLGYYTRNVFREKKRVEQQLKQVRREIEGRPKEVQEALMSVEDEFLRSEFYLSIRKRIAQGERLKQEDWDEIEHQVNSVYSGFVGRLFNLYPMSQTEMKTCLLIKLGVSTTEIANTLNKSTSAISSMRSRLYGKVFHDKGGAKEWDEFILSL